MHRQEPSVGVKKRDGYSRMVTILKWAFPLIGMVLLGSIFVLSNANKIGEVIITDPRIAELALGQKITNPNFSGVTKSGDAFTISANWALPNGPRPTKIELDKPRTTINFENGKTLRTTAGHGELNLESSQALLFDSVNLRTKNGYKAVSTSIEINFETGNVFSAGPVMAEGPVGSIEAGTMTLIQDLDKNPVGEAVLMFNNGVKLIYKPSQG